MKLILNKNKTKNINKVKSLIIIANAFIVPIILPTKPMFLILSDNLKFTNF